MNLYLWKALPRGEKQRIRHTLSSLEPSQLVLLKMPDLALLFQLIFELQHISTTDADVQQDYFDLDFQKENHPEHLRFYPKDPVAAVYRTTTDLRGKDIKKLLIFTLGTFGKADHKAQNESPLFLALKERPDVIEFIRAGKLSYDQTALRQKNSGSKRRPRSFLERFAQFIQKVMNQD
jgi:hypothetical protein